MNSVTQSQRRWRKKSKRGVSPIIATILLVAITVVLAAVLYILISGLTKGPGNTPLGTALALGTPAEASKGTNNWYNFSVQSAGGGILLNNLNFQVQTSSGGIVPVGGSWTFNVLSLTGSVVGTYAMSTGTWTLGGTTAVSSQQQFVLNAVSSALSGDTLVTIGTGSYQGSISTNIP
jgi:flagellin-like protein